MTIRLSVEFITQVPSLKNILAECPERTIARKGILYGMAQNLARINIQAANQPKTNISVEDRGVEGVGIQADIPRGTRWGIQPGPPLGTHKGCPYISNLFRRRGIPPGYLSPRQDSHEGCPYILEQLSKRRQPLSGPWS